MEDTHIYLISEDSYGNVLIVVIHEIWCECEESDVAYNLN